MAAALWFLVYTTSINGGGVVNVVPMPSLATCEAVRDAMYDQREQVFGRLRAQCVQAR